MKLYSILKIDRSFISLMAILLFDRSECHPTPFRTRRPGGLSFLKVYTYSPWELAAPWEFYESEFNDLFDVTAYCQVEIACGSFFSLCSWHNHDFIISFYYLLYF